MDPTITVIIPNWNREDLLRGCLQSLAEQTEPCQVLVVDNGSTDGSVQMVRLTFPNVQILELGANLGFARAVNHGIQEVKTHYVALLNNDTKADPHWIAAALQAFSTYPDHWFFASRMVDFYDPNVLDSAGDCYSRTGMPYKRGAGESSNHYREVEPVLGASAGAAFYRRELFDRIGLFDEGFHMYLEDVDLSMRAQLTGYPCLYVPAAVVHHIEAASDPDRGSAPLPRTRRGYYSKERVFWITRNRWQLMMTYQPARNLPWLLYGWTRSLLYHGLKVGFLSDFLRGVLAGIRETRPAIRKRRALKRTRVLTNGELCRKLQAC